VNPVPVSLCRALGADVVIAVNLNRNVTRREDEGKEQDILSTLLSPLPKGFQVKIFFVSLISRKQQIPWGDTYPKP
jgi:predicted acylesterase/phospholipase RssA